MKILIVNDNGEVVEAIEDIEEYDLNKPLSRADLVNEIQQAIGREYYRIAQPSNKPVD